MTSVVVISHIFFRISIINNWIVYIKTKYTQQDIIKMITKLLICLWMGFQWFSCPVLCVFIWNVSEIIVYQECVWYRQCLSCFQNLNWRLTPDIAHHISVLRILLVVYSEECVSIRRRHIDYMFKEELSWCELIIHVFISFMSK